MLNRSDIRVAHSGITREQALIMPQQALTGQFMARTAMCNQHFTKQSNTANTTSTSHLPFLRTQVWLWVSREREAEASKQATYPVALCHPGMSKPAALM